MLKIIWPFRPRARLATPLLRSLYPFDLSPSPPHELKIPRLPYEVYLSIVRVYVDALIRSWDVRDYRTGRGMAMLGGALMSVALVSKAIGSLTCREWNLYWPLSPPNPPGLWTLARPKVHFEKPNTLPINLSPFRHLRFVSLPADQAVKYRDGAWRPLPLVANLPRSIEELEFIWSHASEAEILALVKELCPWISRLRVVYCTMFNHPKCDWWYNHQLNGDHHYLKGEDLTAATTYAESISASLGDLSRIQQVHFGAYFIPFQAITTHRTSRDHIKHHPVQDKRTYVGRKYQNAMHFLASWADRHTHIPPPDINIDRLAPLALWEKGCAPCIQTWSCVVELAERRAASVLAARVPTLCSVSFASFVATRRTAPSEWDVSRFIEYPSEPRVPVDQNAVQPTNYPAGTRLYIYTKRPNEPHPSQFQLFRWHDGQWII